MAIVNANGSTAVEQCITKFRNTVSVAKRSDFYLQVMNKYPKMFVSSRAVSMNLLRLQNCVTNSKFWKNCNQTGERSQFIKRFSLHKGIIYLKEKNSCIVCWTVQNVKPLFLLQLKILFPKLQNLQTKFETCILKD